MNHRSGLLQQDAIRGFGRQSHAQELAPSIAVAVRHPSALAISILLKDFSLRSLFIWYSKRMTQTYYEVFISAETTEQADTILNSLLEKRLATGGQFLNAPARFLWKGKVENMGYITITSFTTGLHKQALIADVEQTTQEEFPMIRFIPIEANEKLCRWIDQTLK